MTMMIEATPEDHDGPEMLALGPAQGGRGGGNGGGTGAGAGEQDGDRGGRWFTTRHGYRLAYDAAVWSVPTPTALVVIHVGHLEGATPELASLIRDYLASRLVVANPPAVARDYAILRDLLACPIAAGGSPVAALNFEMCSRTQRACAGRHRRIGFTFGKC